jgi:hypothetical protein
MLRVERSLVEGTLPLNGLSGHGVEPQSGGEVTLHQSALVANHEIGLLAAYSASVTVSDSVIAKTIPNMSGMFGRGVDVAAGVTLSIEASALVDNHELALGIGQTGTTVTVTESVIARTAPRPSDQSGGRGIQVQGGGTLTLSGSVVSENHDSAVTLAHPGSIVTIEESLVTKTTAPPSDLTAGRGIVVQDGASLVLDNSTLADNRRTGIVIASGDPQRTAFATVTASLIERTLPDEQEGAYGAGIVCTGSGGLLLSGSAVRASQTSGVLTANGATSDIISALVEDVAPGRVHTYEGDTILATFEGIGDGIVTAFGARANVSDTLVSGAGRAGLLFETSEGALRSVHTRESSIGLVIQGEPGPDWQHDSNVFDGFDQRVVTDGELPVPQAPPLPTE